MHNVAEELNTNTTYNGWSNRETWIVNLWLTNEECYYYELQDIIHGFEESYEQAEELEKYVRFIVARLDEPSLTSELLSTSLGRVDWLEIVQSNQEETR